MSTEGPKPEMGRWLREIGVKVGVGAVRFEFC